MTTARSLAKAIVQQYPQTALSVACEVVRLVAEEQIVCNERGRAMRMPKTYTLETTDQIVAVVCKHHGLTERELVGARRWRHHVEARLMAWHLIRTRLKRSYNNIGEIFGKDYTTVIHGLRRFAPDERLLAAIEQELDALRSGASAPEAAE